MIKAIAAAAANRKTARNALFFFLGAQLVVAVFKIVEVYHHDLPVFHQIAWAGFAEPAAYAAILFNVLLILLSFWASPLMGQYSILTAGGYGYLFYVSLLALVNYFVAYCTGHFYAQVNWLFLAGLIPAGVGNFGVLKLRISALNRNFRPGWFHNPGIYGWIVLVLLLTFLPFLIMPYHFFDAINSYAPKAFAIHATGNAQAMAFVTQANKGINAASLAQGGAYPPLYPIILSLSMMGDHLFEGRIIPFLMFLSFIAVLLHRVPRNGFISRSFFLVYFIATMQVWLGVANYYADVPLMIVGCAAGFLMLDTRSAGDLKADVVAITLFCAAALMRPDGIVTVFCLLLCMFLSGIKKISWYGVAATLSLAAALTWEFRPAWLRILPGYGYLDTSQAANNISLGCGLHIRTVLNFLNAAQGLYLSHYGFGAFFYGFIIVLIAGIRTRLALGKDALSYGIISVLAIGVLVCVYLFVGLFLNNVIPYPLMVRVSFGRATVHFFPFMLLFTVAIINAFFKTQESGLKSPVR